MAGRRGRHAPRDLPLRHAVTLGLVHGPAELLPVSSSGHVVLLPALLGWPYSRLEPSHRKAFEVALHGGTAAGLAVVLRDELREGAMDLDPRSLATDALATGPAAACGLLFHDAISERLSEPRRVALAQVLSGVALGLADLRQADRVRECPSLADALAVGAAQATALAPGVSRAGAALTVLRLRRLQRGAAGRISRRAAVPVIIGAALLEAARFVRKPPPPTLAPSAAGAVAAFGSTLAAARLVRAMDGARSYAPVAAYRIALGALALRRLQTARRGRTAVLRRAVEWRS